MINSIAIPDITNATTWPNQTNAATNHRNQLTAQFNVLGASTNTELQKLNSVIDGSSGADQIGMTPLTITGTANTVQSVVEGLDTKTVKTTTNQSITGVKTFITSPVTGTPTTDTQVANKLYVDTAAVALTGDQTIAGVKTFSSSPIVPTPTTDMQTSTKKYVDDNTVKLTGNQTVAGIKTFSSSPVVPAPTTDLQTATKKYVDDKYASGFIPYAVATVGSGVLTATITGATLTEGQGICIKVPTPVTGGASIVTLNINGLGARDIYCAELQTDALVPVGLKMLSASIYTLRYSTVPSNMWIIQ